MPDETPTPPPEKSLRELLEDRFKELRATDGLIGLSERQIARHKQTMRKAYQLQKLARRTIRAQEEWLREEAAQEIRKRLGIASIPGFSSKRETARAFRDRLQQRVLAARNDSKTQLTG